MDSKSELFEKAFRALSKCYGIVQQLKYDSSDLELFDKEVLHDSILSYVFLTICKYVQQEKCKVCKNQHNATIENYLFDLTYLIKEICKLVNINDENNGSYSKRAAVLELCRFTKCFLDYLFGFDYFEKKINTFVTDKIRNLQIPFCCIDKVSNGKYESSGRTLAVNVNRQTWWIFMDLIENETNLNDILYEDKTLLQYIVAYNPLNVIKYLIKKGANIHAKGEENDSVQGRTGIQNTTVNQSDLDAPKRWRVEFLGPGSYGFRYHATASQSTSDSILHDAVKINTIDVVLYLVENGADIHAKDEDDNNVLHRAVEKNTIDVVKYLVENGVDIHANNQWDNSVLHWAVVHNTLDVVQYLVENGGDIRATNGDNQSVLHEAVVHNTLDVVQYLVENGGDIHAKGDLGKSVLDWAVAHNTIDVVKYLVEKGADIHAKNGNNLSVLHWADTIDVVKYLVEIGADINAKSETNESVLHWAVMKKTIDVVKYLVENGADIHVKDCRNSSVLHWAVQDNTIDVVKYLVEKGADIHAEDEDNNSVLHDAVEKSTIDVVKYLVENGADIHAKNKHCTSVIDLAVLNNKINVVKFLVENGAYLNASTGSTAYYEFDNLHLCNNITSRGAGVNTFNVRIPDENFGNLDYHNQEQITNKTTLDINTTREMVTGPEPFTSATQCAGSFEPMDLSTVFDPEITKIWGIQDTAECRSGVEFEELPHTVPTEMQVQNKKAIENAAGEDISKEATAEVIMRTDATAQSTETIERNLYKEEIKEVPVLKIQNSDIKIISSKRGKPLLIYEERMHEICGQNKKTNIIYWRCQEREKCKARIHTKDSEIITTKKEHTCEIKEGKIKAKEIYCNMRKRARESDQLNSIIVHENLGNLSEESAIRAYLPANAHIKRTLRRIRQGKRRKIDSREEQIEAQDLS